MELIPELREIESFQKSLKLNSIDGVATSGQKPTEKTLHSEVNHKT